MRRAVRLGWVVAAWLLMAAPASGFVLHTTSSGTPVRWGVDTLTLVADPSLQALDPATEDAARAALATWAAVPDAALPQIDLVEGVADEIGYRVGEPNQSTLRYAPEGVALAGDTLAVTVLTFDAAGTILDADIVINGHQGRRFGVLQDGADATSDTFDLQDVLTHEAGHLFGLAHNNADPTLTMYYEILPGETSKRHLHSDDEHGVISLYPQSAADDTPVASCSASGQPWSPAPYWLTVAVLGGAAAAAVRARSRRARVMAGMTALLIAPLLQLPGASARDAATAGEPAAVHETAVARVIAATPRWESGLVVTALTLRTGGEAPEVAVTEVYGGAVSGIRQVVGGQAVPAVGEELAVRRDRDRGLLPAELVLRPTRALP